MTKILNFALKIKGGGREGGTCEVLQHCHPPPKKKFGTCTSKVPPLGSMMIENRATFLNCCISHAVTDRNPKLRRSVEKALK